MRYFILSLLFILSSIIFAETYFVRPGGTATADGLTYNTALNNLDSAYNKVTNGDEIILINYSETRTADIPNTYAVSLTGVGNVTITFTGNVGIDKTSWANSVTYKNITFSVTTAYSANTAWRIRNETSSQVITFENCDFLNFSYADGGSAGNPFYIEFKGNITFKKCYLRNFITAAYTDSSEGTYLKLVNCIWEQGDASTDTHALYLYNDTGTFGGFDIRNTIFKMTTANRRFAVHFNAYNVKWIARCVARNNIFVNQTCKYNSSTSTTSCTEVVWTSQTNHNANDTTFTSSEWANLRISDGITLYDSNIFSAPLAADTANTGDSDVDGYPLEGEVSYRGITQNKQKVRITQ